MQLWRVVTGSQVMQELVCYTGIILQLTRVGNERDDSHRFLTVQTNERVCVADAMYQILL